MGGTQNQNIILSWSSNYKKGEVIHWMFWMIKFDHVEERILVEWLVGLITQEEKEL